MTICSNNYVFIFRLVWLMVASCIIDEYNYQCYGNVQHSNGQVQFLDLGQFLISGRSYYSLFEIRPQNLLDNLTPISNNIKSLSYELECHLEKIQRPGQSKLQATFNVSVKMPPHMETINSVLTAQLVRHIKFLAIEIAVKHNRIENFIRALGTYNLDSDHELDVIGASSILFVTNLY